MERRKDIEMGSPEEGLAAPSKNADASPNEMEFADNQPSAQKEEDAIVANAQADAEAPPRHLNGSESDITHEDDASDAAPHDGETARNGVSCAVNGKTPSREVKKL